MRHGSCATIVVGRCQCGRISTSGGVGVRWILLGGRTGSIPKIPAPPNNSSCCCASRCCKSCCSTFTCYRRCEVCCHTAHRYLNRCSVKTGTCTDIIRRVRRQGWCCITGTCCEQCPANSLIIPIKNCSGRNRAARR